MKIKMITNKIKGMLNNYIKIVNLPSGYKPKSLKSLSLVIILGFSTILFTNNLYLYFYKFIFDVAGLAFQGGGFAHPSPPPFFILMLAILTLGNLIYVIFTYVTKIYNVFINSIDNFIFNKKISKNIKISYYIYNIICIIILTLLIIRIYNSLILYDNNIKDPIVILSFIICIISLIYIDINSNNEFIIKNNVKITKLHYFLQSITLFIFILFFIRISGGAMPFIDTIYCHGDGETEKTVPGGGTAAATAPILTPKAAGAVGGGRALAPASAPPLTEDGEGAGGAHPQTPSPLRERVGTEAAATPLEREGVGRASAPRSFLRTEGQPPAVVGGRAQPLDSSSTQESPGGERAQPLMPSSLQGSPNSERGRTMVRKYADHLADKMTGKKKSLDKLSNFFKGIKISTMAPPSSGDVDNSSTNSVSTAVTSLPEGDVCQSNTIRLSRSLNNLNLIQEFNDTFYPFPNDGDEGGGAGPCPSSSLIAAAGGWAAWLRHPQPLMPGSPTLGRGGATHSSKEVGWLAEPAEPGSNIIFASSAGQEVGATPVSMDVEDLVNTEEGDSESDNDSSITAKISDNDSISSQGSGRTITKYEMSSFDKDSHDERSSGPNTENIYEFILNKGYTSHFRHRRELTEIIDELLDNYRTRQDGSRFIDINPDELKYLKSRSKKLIKKIFGELNAISEGLAKSNLSTSRKVQGNNFIFKIKDLLLSTENLFKKLLAQKSINTYALMKYSLHNMYSICSELEYNTDTYIYDINLRIGLIEKFEGYSDLFKKNHMDSVNGICNKYNKKVKLQLLSELTPFYGEFETYSSQFIKLLNYVKKEAGENIISALPSNLSPIIELAEPPLWEGRASDDGGRAGDELADGWVGGSAPTRVGGGSGEGSAAILAMPGGGATAPTPTVSDDKFYENNDFSERLSNPSKGPEDLGLDSKSDTSGDGVAASGAHTVKVDKGKGRAI